MVLTRDHHFSWLVKAWDYSTWPAYKSRLWNKEQKGQKGGKEGRKSK